MLNKQSKLLFSIFVLSLSGCSFANQDHELQDKYAQSLGEKILIHMDLETMFPSEKLRTLANAAGKGQISTVDKLLRQGVDINSKGTENATVLFWSMRNETGFNHLLEMGADPNVVFGDGGSVMHWAARKSDCSMLEAALKHGGNPNLKAGMYGGSPLFETITVGNNKGIPECLKLLLQSGADINLQDDKGQTILLMAADLARFDIVLYLLQQGADITAVDKKNQNIKSLHHSYEGAFKKGSVTEKYWFRVKNWLDTKKGKE
jgi:hypothetical protein